MPQFFNPKPKARGKARDAAGEKCEPTLSSQLKKKSGSDLINEWLDADPVLEGGHRRMKERNSAAEIEFDDLFDNLDDWQKFNHLSPIADNMVCEGFSELGGTILTGRTSDHLDRLPDPIAPAGPRLLVGKHPPELPSRAGLKTLIAALAFVTIIAVFFLVAG